nr:NADH dehydrogenase subunit 4 [Membranacea stenoprocessa]
MNMFMLFMIPVSLMKLGGVFQLSIILLMMICMNSNSMVFMSMISYFMGLDFLSYGLIMLTFFIISLMVMSFNFNNMKNKDLFLLSNLLLCFCLYMIFMSMNLLIMYIFFEFSLIPLIIMVFGWGYQPERLMSGLYLFFYTLFASLPLLFLMIIIYIKNGNLFIDNNLFMSNMLIINISMILAFMVKLPMFMLHFWLPSAHVQAPVFGSMILAGLLLKIGGYGITRFMFMMKSLFFNYTYIWYSLSILGSMMVSFICLVQSDVKSMIAYSSVAHMGLCITSSMTMTNWGLFGIYMLMLSHGLCSSAMFCLISISYERYSSRSFFINSGLNNIMPSMSMFWFLLCAFNMSCPPSMNFISEMFIISSMINYWSNSIILFFFISFLSACFSYYIFSFSQHGNFHYLYCTSLGYSREYLLLTMHIIPIVTMIMMLNLFFY